MIHYPHAEYLNSRGSWLKIEWEVVWADKELMKWEDIYAHARAPIIGVKLNWLMQLDILSYFFLFYFYRSESNRIFFILFYFITWVSEEWIKLDFNSRGCQYIDLKGVWYNWIVRAISIDSNFIPNTAVKVFIWF